MTHRVLPSLAALALLAACNPGTPTLPGQPAGAVTPGASGAGPTAMPGGAGPGAPSAAPTVAAGAYVFGDVRVDDAPVTQAAVRVYLPGSPAPRSQATTTAEGQFAFDFPEGVAPGTLMTVVATQDGKNLASIVGAGAGNIVGAGAGNIIAAGGGNLISIGGGNIVGAGAGNYALAEVKPGQTTLTLGSTLAVAALGRRLRDALAAAATEADRAKVLGEVDKLAAEADRILGAAGTPASLRDAVRSALDDRGQGSVSAAAARQLVRQDPALATAFRETAAAIGDLLTSLGRSDVPDADFGGVTVSDRTPSGGGGSSGGVTPTPNPGTGVDATAVTEDAEPVYEAFDFAFFSSDTLAGGFNVHDYNGGAASTGSGGAFVLDTPMAGQGGAITDDRTTAALAPGHYVGVVFDHANVSGSPASTTWRMELVDAGGEVLAQEAIAVADTASTFSRTFAELGLTPAAAMEVRGVRFVYESPGAYAGLVVTDLRYSGVGAL